ncbi:MAG: carbohydrate porin, partial [Caulobacteraceae bacterium]
YRVQGRDGSLKLTVFDTHAAQGSWADAVALAEQEGDVPQVDAVRRTRDRLGASLNLQQKISSDLGLFARAGWADGRLQGYSFSDIDRTVAGGVSLNGRAWGREDDTVGIGGALNFASADFTTYLNKGGLGLVIGDGQLPHPGAEGIVEAFYEWAFSDAVQATFDYQLVNNPGYNRDRGPVSLFALRLHAAL